MEAKYLAVTIALAVFLFVVDLIRREKMTFKYSFSWLCSCFAVLVLAFNETFLREIAHLAGFDLTSNFVFFLLLSFFVVLSLLLTLYVNEQNYRSESLAQAVGILELKIRRLETEGRGVKSN